MVEEYSYNRIVFSHSEGITETDEPVLRRIAGEYTDGRRMPPEELPVYSKRWLPDGRVVFQRLSQVGSQWLSRGYVVQAEDEMPCHPEWWGFSAFSDGAQGAAGGAPKDIPPLMPLHGLLRSCQLTLEGFITLVCGCFDACNWGELVLVALNEEQPNHAMLEEQLICWIYRLLPFSMRRRADFTTFFDHVRPQGYTLGLVPLNRVVEYGDNLRVATKYGYFNGAGYLLAKGRVLHDPSRTGVSFGDSNQVYRQWLEGLIRGMYPLNSNEVRMALENLDGIYEQFDRRIGCLPEEKRCDPRYYSALCWDEFYRGKGGVTEAQERDCFQALLAFGELNTVEDAVEEMLETLECEYVSPASEEQIDLLARILLLGEETPFFLRARELLCAFLSRDMEGVESDESSSVSARYFQLLTRAGLSRNAQIDLLERVFFPGEFPLPQEIDELGIWEGIGTSRSEKEGGRRCADWVGGYANICNSGDELIDCCGTILRELEGMTPERMDSVLKTLLAAQEIRFHYARFEITPGNLVECCGRIREVQDDPDDAYAREAENHYRALLRQLSKNLMEYLSRKFTLSTMLQLNAAFEGREDLTWMRQDLFALTVTQCDFIVNYSWENLKLRFGQEDQGLFHRLGEVLDLFRTIEAGQERMNQICHQTCRYLVHALPEYLTEQWVLEEIKELTGVNPGGYYRELLALKEFLTGEERSLEELRQAALKFQLTNQMLKDLMKLIFRMFRGGRLQNLALLTVQGIYVVAGEKMKLTQLEVFRCICDQSGLTAFAELLEQWPSAELPAGSSRWRQRSQRKGAYPWLKTDQALMDTLMQMSQESVGLKRMAEKEPDSLGKLMEAVDRLAPSGSLLRRSAIQINRNLYKMWYQEQKMLKKVTSKSWKKRLLEE